MSIREVTSTYQAAPPKPILSPIFGNGIQETLVNIYTIASGSIWSVCNYVSLSNFLHDKVISQMNPAVQEDKLALSQLKKNLTNFQENYEIIQFLSPQGVQIECIFFPARNESADQKNAIIFAMGSGGSYEKIADPNDAGAKFAHFFRDNFGDEAALMIINYEGIGESKGSPSIDNWGLDLYSAYDFLKAKGFDYVVLYGHSLGGHLVLKASESISSKYNTAPPAVLDRSFPDIQQFFHHYFGGGAMGSVAQGITVYTGLNSTVAPLNGQRVFLINAIDDPTVNPSAGMCSMFASGDNVQTMQITGGDGVFSSHTRLFNKFEEKEVINFIKSSFDC